MTCDEARAVLPGTSPELEAHLVGCPTCRRDVEELGRVIALVRATASRPTETIVPRFDDVLAEVRSPRRRAGPWLARAAALLLAALAGGALDRAARTRPASAPSPAVEARAAIAGRPGSLGSSLAVLDALARGR